jgi:hypothetical protein
MLEQFRNFLRHLRETREAAALSDRELADIGISRDQLHFFMNLRQDVPERVAAMAAVFGVSETDLRAVHGEYLDILGTCGTCADHGACGVALAEGSLKGPDDCTFCPNWDIFHAKARTPA